LDWICLPKSSLPDNAGQRTIRISNWKAFSQNTLRGFFSVTLPSGLIIHNCSLHEKNDSRWIGLPAQSYRKKDGSVGYVRLIEFTSSELADNFRRQVLDALTAAGLP
jgi:DNA-binding cell septation regulator SpoVG